MRIFLSPQESSDKINYQLQKDLIQVEMSDKSMDVFDFRDFPDGILDTAEIETSLSINPIISAKRENGELWVELLNFISPDATEEDKFPKWIDSKEYRKPKVGEMNG